MHTASRPPQTTATFVAPWSLQAWRPLLWQAGPPVCLTLRHLGTHVMFDKPRAHPLSGQTLWGGRAGDGDAGLAWDWVQLSQGVLALADPLCIVTNLRLLDDGGEPLAPMPAARWLNQIVHTLPWQDAVVQAIRRPP